MNIRRGSNAEAAYELQSSAFGPGVANAILRNQRASLTLGHALTKTLTARLTYSYLRQRSQGPVLYLANVDRNRASLGIFYDFGKFSLGR